MILDLLIDVTHRLINEHSHLIWFRFWWVMLWDVVLCDLMEAEIPFFRPLTCTHTHMIALDEGKSRENKINRKWYLWCAMLVILLKPLIYQCINRTFVIPPLQLHHHNHHHHQEHHLIITNVRIWYEYINIWQKFSSIVYI